MVISLPVGRQRPARMDPAQPRQPGEVVILPVIRIERHCEEPAAGLDTALSRAQGRKRRRRASRS
jgi:hypothetical protein